ncbi:hypothetical protein A0O28_0094570 [Trichoderma guizhouense]|uniref:Uncharacterized protein n=1 Tax=Trichoderma guizhouense TaxID=1491466 RepID=A0A1T3CXR1_9HYPO|nr:hypothetical protein A0O28_0094570 [Trichoderma guizhouense]
MSWATSPFEFSLPFPEDKWALQEDFTSADMTRGLFHHEETFEKEHDPTFSEASVASQSELAHLFAISTTTIPVSAELSQTLHRFDLYMPPAANELALQIKRLRGL